MSQIAMIGGGAWGTGLAIVLGRKGSHRVRVWAHEVDVCESINRHHVNERFLPGRSLPDSVSASNDLGIVLEGAQIIVSVMPSQHCRALFARMRPLIRAANAHRQRYQGSRRRISAAHDGSDRRRCSTRRRSPATRRCAQRTILRTGSRPRRPDGDHRRLARPDLLSTVQQEFSDASFRVYTNSDVIGVELGGALKNIIAIAAGICDGLGLGHNSVAALITRGLAEMTRLVVACGGRSETMAGLAGLGDLVLTCTGGLSRNRSVGVELGRGKKLPEIIAGMHGMVAEGVFTTTAAVGLAHARKVEMPITEQMHAILHEGKSPKEALQELMMRTGKSETTS